MKGLDNAIEVSEVVMGSPGLRQLVALKDWSRTPLGPPEDWSEALRTTVETCLGSRFPVIIFWGPELVQIYNDSYRPILGSKHPEALGQTAAECFPEIWDVVGPMLRGVLQTGEATWSDDLLLMLERGGFPEECYFTFSYSPAGPAPVEGVFCAVIETTRRVLGERRLDVLRDLSTSLAGIKRVDEALDVALSVLSRHPDDLPAGVLREPNAEDQGSPTRGGSERWWPTAPSEEGSSSSGVTRRNDLNRVVDEAAGGTAEAVGRPRWATYNVKRPGSAKPAALLGVELNPNVPFDDSYRDFLSLVVAAIGAGLASAEGQEEADLRAEALEEIDRAKTAFLTNISHEFRTPLTLLLGPLADSAADPRLPDEVQAVLAMAERNGRRLLKLVNSLLDVARLEAGRVVPAFEPIDVSTATSNLASVFSSAVDDAGIALVIDCQPLGRTVSVDPEMWEQIVTNLCANAVKYTNSGSIEVRLRAEGTDVRLEVADTGVGIPADDLPFVFDRFRRARTPGVRTEEGTGLGLAIVRELVHLHGGTVEVESTPGVGSLFTVTIPMFRTDEVATPTAEGMRALSSTTEEVVRSLQSFARDLNAVVDENSAREADESDIIDAACTDEMSVEDGAPVIYVIDDNSDMRSYLSGLLSKYWRVRTFDDPVRALQAIRRRPPDLVLSDVMMPGLDGFGLVSELRSDPATAQVTLVLLSARAGEEAALEGLEAGADDYLVKPFTARALLARLRSHLDLSALRREATNRAVRHTHQLTALSRAAGDLLSTERIATIVGIVELSGRQMTGAANCTLDLYPQRSTNRKTIAPHSTGANVFAVDLMLADGSVIGRLTLTDTPDGVFDDEQRNLVAQLANVAARRIENIRRYQREHRLADALQKGLLPRSLPHIPGLEMAARYRPASDAAEVGGDWYDALAIPDGRLVVVVGDVMGHDLDAAVTMGELRHLLRAHAPESSGPAELCDTVNRLFRTVVEGKQMATAVVAFIDPQTGDVSVVSAGHPPWLLLDPNGPVHVSLDVPGVPLGASFLAKECVSSEFNLTPGSTLIFYTDGLIESREEALDVSIAKLAERCSGLCDSSLDAALDFLVESSLEATSSRDDVAVLAVRRWPS
jgi:signal transduction histidine kinase/serine phosphatase RsbU (regulator of sigma subunit)/CheY-like chemotaxis protein